MDQSTTSIKSSAINLGVYLGVLLSAITTIAYAVSLELLTEWWLGIILILAIIIFGIISSNKARTLLGGFISFKDAFSAYFITIAIGIGISSLVSILIFNVVDSEAAVTLQEIIMNKQVAMMEKFGTPKEAIDQALAEVEASGSLYSITNILKSFAFQLVGYSVVGLIVALVVKRKNPDLT